GKSILAPLEVVGLDKFEESAVILQFRLKTLPSQQWAVGREFNRRMKKAFEANQIEMPFPHRTIYFGEDRAGRAPPVHVALEELAGAPARLAHDGGGERDADGGRRAGAHDNPLRPFPGGDGARRKPGG